jgi:flagellar motor protein MotB
VISGERGRRNLFPFSVWPPMVDAVTLVLAAFVLITIVALLAQRALLEQLRESERDLLRTREDKARVERRLATLATGVVEIDEGKVILQGEVLFDSGSDALRPEGRAFLEHLAVPLASLLEAEPGHMVMVGGHTDDRPIHTDEFPSNWELSTARAVAVMHALSAAGVPPARIVAAGFGSYHARAPNGDDDGRRRNRRIELLVVPIRAVSSQ